MINACALPKNALMRRFKACLSVPSINNGMKPRVFVSVLDCDQAAEFFTCLIADLVEVTQGAVLLRTLPNGP